MLSRMPQYMHLIVKYDFMHFVENDMYPNPDPNNHTDRVTRMLTTPSPKML